VAIYGFLRENFSRSQAAKPADIDRAYRGIPQLRNNAFEPAFVNACRHGRVLIFKCSFNLMPLSDHDVGQRRLADLERLVAQVLTV
jgi:hypothetical protein